MIEDLLRFWIQTRPPSGILAFKAPQPDVRSKIDENRVEENITIGITSGTERGQARAGGRPFVQESIFVGIKESENPGGGVFDQYGLALDQELSRKKNDKFILPAGRLDSTGQHNTLRQRRKSILTLNQSIFWLRPGSFPKLSICLARCALSSARRILIL